MGKGDRKSKKGKRFMGSYGKKRPKSNGTAFQPSEIKPKKETKEAAEKPTKKAAPKKTAAKKAPAKKAPAKKAATKKTEEKAEENE
ncbi:MAG: 30S ribosomal protein THX [Bacteroidota bacterium]